jgi:hypothetical protein
VFSHGICMDLGAPFIFFNLYMFLGVFMEYLFVRWQGKIQRGGGLISFFLNGLFLEGKSMSLLKIFLLFRCVFEAMFKVKS